jgi:tetratricopeptide (TPR) repeat protein
MTQGNGFFICLTCAERHDAVRPSPAKGPFSGLESLPFPVAFPLAHALDPTLCPDADKRFDNMIFAASQALRLTALLLLSDYFECETTCSKLDTHIRSLRMPHWENWSHLARALSKFWRGQEEQKPERPCRFPWLPDAWLEVASTTVDASRWRDSLKSIPGKAGHAVSVNDAFQKARNDGHHRLTTRSSDSAKACEKVLRQLLPLLCEACAVLFPKDKLVLLRQIPTDPSLCIRLEGPHMDKRFLTEPIPPFSAPVFALSEVVALSDSNCIALYPLIVPIDTGTGAGNLSTVEVLEPATLLDQARKTEVVLLGVEKWWVKEDYAKPFIEASERKRVDLGLSDVETTIWNLASWSTENAKANLQELIGKKYFPDCYVERRGVDDVFSLCLQSEGKGILLIGDAGSGKSSLLCRFIESLTDPHSREPQRPSSKKGSSKSKTGTLEGYLKSEGTNDAVIFLSGRAAFGGDTGLSGSVLLCECVLQKAGILPGAFDSLEKWAAAVHASTRQDTVSRKIWLVLDALNEADRFQDLLSALDKFLPHLPRFPWLKLIVSIRSGAYHALSVRHSDLARSGPGFLESEHYFHSFENKGSDKPVPYLEIKPFAQEEGARAYQLRQERLPEKSVSLPWDELNESVRELLLTPLYLHLFHETFSQGRIHPRDLDAESLLDAYLAHLCTQNPGLEKTLQRIGALMFEKRVPALPAATADAWLSEWRNSGSQSIAEKSAKLNPIEELISASLLMRPTEHGVGVDRHLAAFQFRHQKLCEQVLVRELRRQIAPRPLPTGEELTAWVGQIAGTVEDGSKSGTSGPFKELLGAVQSMTSDVILAGEAGVFAALLPIKAEDLRRQVISGGLLKSRLDLHKAEIDVFLKNLAEYAGRNHETANSLVHAFAHPLEKLNQRGQTLITRKFWVTAHTIIRARLETEPRNFYLKQALSFSLISLGDLSAQEGDTKIAQSMFKESLQITRSLLKSEQSSGDIQLDLLRNLIVLSDLSHGTGDTKTARTLAEESLHIIRPLIDVKPHHTDLKHALSGILERIGRFYGQSGDIQTAQALFDESMQITRALVAAEPHRTDRKLLLSGILDQRGCLYDQHGDTQTAQALFDESLQITRSLITAEPHRTDLKLHLVGVLHRISHLHHRAGNSEMARILLEEACLVSETLVTAQPQLVESHLRLAYSSQTLAQLYDQHGESEKARVLFKKSLQAFILILEVSPDLCEAKKGVSSLRHDLGRLCIREGNYKKARFVLEESLKMYRRLFALAPQRIDFQSGVSLSLKYLGDLSFEEGDIKTAHALFAEGLQIDRVLAETSHELHAQSNLALTIARVGQISADMGYLERARLLLEEAYQILKPLVEAAPYRTDLKLDLSWLITSLGTLSSGMGSMQKARIHFEEALQINRVLFEEESDQVDLQWNLSCSITRLGRLLAKEGDEKGAHLLFKESMQVLSALVKKCPNRNDFKEHLADLHELLEGLSSQK